MKLQLREETCHVKKKSNNNFVILPVREADFHTFYEKKLWQQEIINCRWKGKSHQNTAIFSHYVQAWIAS